MSKKESGENDIYRILFSFARSALSVQWFKAGFQRLIQNNMFFNLLDSSISYELTFKLNL